MLAAMIQLVGLVINIILRHGCASAFRVDKGFGVPQEDHFSECENTDGDAL
jgi:hypothetical protein